MSNLEERLERMEKRLSAMEETIRSIEQAVARQASSSGAAPDQAVVTLLARQLQRLVPQTCEHPPEQPDEEQTLEGTDVRCTEEVQRRVKRIPIPFAVTS